MKYNPWYNNLFVDVGMINYIKKNQNIYVQNCQRRRLVGKIAALLQAIGLSVGSCGLANVLQ